MNACETAASFGGDQSWEGRYDIFGLARAFLDTGAYLIGSRWEIGDESASAFAAAFYSHLIRGISVGEAIRLARTACRKACPGDDFSWASYIFYGDPRLLLQSG
jgi:CHAT domain-containing protein